MLYLATKTVHILSAAVLFGTGMGIAFFFLMGMRSGDPAAAWFAARTTVVADMAFTLTAGIVQPVSGLVLIHLGGIDPREGGLVATLISYDETLGTPALTDLDPGRDCPPHPWKLRREARFGPLPHPHLP